MSSSQGQKHLFVIFGAIFSFLLITGIGYYIGYVFTWDQFRHQPKIGAEPLKIKLVFVTKEIGPDQAIDYDSVEERHDVRSNVALDAYNFASEVMGRKAKWALHKGQYLSRHDVQPAPLPVSIASPPPATKATVAPVAPVK